MTVSLFIEINITEVSVQDKILQHQGYHLQLMKKHSERHDRLSVFVGLSIGNDVPGNDTVGRQRQASEVGGSHRWLVINGPAIGSTRPMC